MPSEASNASPIQDPAVAAIFQPDATKAPKALLVAGCCGNVGFGKLGQFARILSKHHVPVVALDLSDAVQGVKERLADAMKKRFSPEQIAAITDGITIVQGTLDDVPAELELGFVFEAIPERLDIKRPFYEAIRKRDPEAYVFSATSGLTTKHLFEGIEGADRSGVMHPFFPHLTNKLWEVPTQGGTTSKETIKVVSKFLGRFGMNVLAVKDVPSFAADRIFCGMMLEAVRIVDSTDLTPAQVDDACKKLLGTSPFFVHNLIPGANYLSAHCMELMKEEVDSSLYDIPDSWQPYVADPKKQWPYERGQTCPPEQFAMVRTRMLGMLFALTAYMVEHEIAKPDVLNFLTENALAFRMGVPAMITELGFDEAKSVINAFVDMQKITKADEVAPLGALSKDKRGWDSIYVGTSVHDGVGLISLKRRTINHGFIRELDLAIEKLEADPAVKAMVVAPDGQLSREFGHGADPSCFVPTLGDYDKALNLIKTWKATTSKLSLGKPTVAALVGRVLGGSNELASCCHARIAGAGTRIGQPEPTVGVVPGLGGCNHIHRFSKPEAAERINELLLTGHSFTAEEAAEWGYVNRIVPIKELPAASMAYAAELAGDPSQRPTFRTEGVPTKVNRDVDPKNEQGVPHDADLRELIASTIEQSNAADYAKGTIIEQEAAAKSLTMSSTAIGVKAILRGKPPAFEKPLA